jgi:hypothetical protein
MSYGLCLNVPSFDAEFASLRLRVTDNNNGTATLAWNAAATVDGYYTVFVNGTPVANVDFGNPTTYNATVNNAGSFTLQVLYYNLADVQLLASNIVTLISPIVLSVTDNADGTATLVWTDSTTRTEGYYEFFLDGLSQNSGDFDAPKTAVIDVNDPSAPKSFYITYNLVDATLIATSNTVTRTITGDTAARDWITLQEAAGYTFTSPQRTGAHTAFSSLRSGNRLEHLYLVNLFCMGTSARNLIPFYNPLGLTPTFNGGITHNSKSITYNGSTGYFNSGFTPSTHGWTKGSFALGYYLAAVVAADNSAIQGCLSSLIGTIQLATRFSGVGSFADSGLDRMTATSNGTKGIRDFIKTSSTNAYLSHYTGSVSTLASKTDCSDANITIPTNQVIFGARANGGGVESYGTETHGLIWIGGNGMTTADRDAVDAIFYDLLVAFGAT